MPVKGGYLLLAGCGGLLLYSGIKGKSFSSAFRNLLSGKSPSTAANANTITTPVTAGGPNQFGTAVASGASVSAIATDALEYRGAGYVWGGAPADGIGNWDCSSFANWVCGHDLSLAIPGYPSGSYTGSVHGPNTVMWLAWPGLSTVGHNGNEAQAGDLAIWETHMGICTGPNQMISALNPTDGTQVSNINGEIPEPLTIRRYKTAAVTSAPTG